MFTSTHMPWMETGHGQQNTLPYQVLYQPHSKPPSYRQRYWKTLQSKCIVHFSYLLNYLLVFIISFQQRTEVDAVKMLFKMIAFWEVTIMFNIKQLLNVISWRIHREHFCSCLQSSSEEELQVFSPSLHTRDAVNMHHKYILRSSKQNNKNKRVSGWVGLVDARWHVDKQPSWWAKFIHAFGLEETTGCRPLLYGQLKEKE